VASVELSAPRHGPLRLTARCSPDRLKFYAHDLGSIREISYPLAGHHRIERTAACMFDPFVRKGATAAIDRSLRRSPPPYDYQRGGHGCETEYATGTLMEPMEGRGVIMFYLVYSSRAAHAFCPSELEKLLGVSRNNNRRDGLTGLLLHLYDDSQNSAFFVQILEGGQRAVERTYARIRADTRHSEVMALDSGPLEKPHFEGWHMRLAELPQSGLQAAAQPTTVPTPRPSSNRPSSHRTAAATPEIIRDAKKMTKLIISYGAAYAFDCIAPLPPTPD
jgi:hypothetical protein